MFGFHLLKTSDQAYDVSWYTDGAETLTVDHRLDPMTFVSEEGIVLTYQP